MSNITGNKRNADNTLNANKKLKTEKSVTFNKKIRIKHAPTYTNEYNMVQKPGQEYHSPKHINGESPSGSEYKLENSEEGTLKPMSPETTLEPLASEYRGIYLLSIGNNTIPIVDNKGQSYALLYEPTENIKNIYEDAIDGLNNNELHIQSRNGLRRIAIDMIKDKVIKDREGNVKEIKKQIYYGRAPFSSNRVFKKFNNSNKLITYRKIIQQNGSNYFYVVFELNNTISGGSNGTKFPSSGTFGSSKKHKKRLTAAVAVGPKVLNPSVLNTHVGNKVPLKTIKNKK